MAGEKIYLNNIDNEDLVNLREGSTGLLSGGVLSVGTGGPGVATTYDISDGNGKVVTELGVETSVSWTGLTGEIPIFGVSVITFVAINNVGAVVQQSTPFTTLQSRTLIILGVVVHVNGVNVDTVNNEQHISYNVMSSVYDAMESIGFFNVTGNVFSANGANMTINKSLGSLFKMGSNYDIDVNNPHVRTNAATIGGIFQYRFSDGSSGILTETNIDPDNLDDGAGGLTAVGNNQWSVQRIYIFTSNNIKIQRGVSEYASSSAAINGIPTEPYVTEPSIAANGLFRGWLIVKEGATVLNGVDAIFLSAGKFGEAGGSVGSGSVTTLQTAYLNSLSNPEILTDVTGGALSLRRGSAADTDDVLEVQNGAGTQTFAVDGNGNVTTSGTVDGIDVNTDVTANNAKVTNVSTDLSIGTKTASTVDVNSSDGTNATIPSFTSTEAGLAPSSGGGTTNFLRADGTWAATGGGSSPLTTKGDLFTYDTGTQRLPVGANGYILEADSAEATGLKYSKKPWKRVFYGYNMPTAAGYGWNGLTNPDLVNASAATLVEERWYLSNYSGGASGQEGRYFEFALPNTYIAGSDIKITAQLLTNSASGNAVFYIGVAQPSGAGVIQSGDTGSEFVSNTITGVAGWTFIPTTFTFDGTNMSPGDPLAIMIYRDPDDVSDTLTTDAYMHTLLIEEV